VRDDCLKVRKTANGWSACCPAHDDNSPSLSIAIGEGGTVLIYCHAKCAYEDIIEALEQRGITWPVAVRGQPANRVGATVTPDIVQIMTRIDQRLKPIANTRGDRYLTGRGITARAPRNSATIRRYFIRGRVIGAGGRAPTPLVSRRRIAIMPQIDRRSHSIPQLLANLPLGALSSAAGQDGHR
jgi:hypothetical protein